MLTGMSEGDWEIVLEVFEAAQSRRGEPGHDDRKFLEALHFFTVHNITWRALPAEFGNWNSVWKRFWRLSRSGVFEAFFQLLAETSKTAHLVQMFDSTVVRAHVSAAGAKGGSKIRRSGARGVLDQDPPQGGFRRPAHRLPSDRWEASDCTQLETSLDIGPDITPRAALTDKGYDSAANRAACRRRGIVPVIPHRANAKARPAFFPKILYRARARIEQTVGKLKRFKRVALRCEKTADSYGALVAFACGLILIKSVHTS